MGRLVMNRQHSQVGLLPGNAGKCLDNVLKALAEDQYGVKPPLGQHGFESQQDVAGDVIRILLRLHEAKVKVWQ